MKFSEKLVEKIIFACAAVSAASVALITIFIFGRGLPILAKAGPVAFITGGNWSPGNEVYGILPLIAGSISVTLGALIIGVPLGISCAVFLAEVLGKRQAKFFQSAIELLAGIPSVVYGFFGLIILVPALRKLTHAIHADSGATGFSILAGAIILAIMILPTIVSMSTNAINAVPLKYREASLAMGADKRETITKVILPAAKSGIFSSAVLGMGRAIGENAGHHRHGDELCDTDASAGAVCHRHRLVHHHHDPQRIGPADHEETGRRHGKCVAGKSSNQRFTSAEPGLSLPLHWRF